MHMRKRRIGQAAEVDHIGTAPRMELRAFARIESTLIIGASMISAKIRMSWPLTIEVTPALAEIVRQVFQLLRTALEPRAEMHGQRVEIHPAAPRYDHAVRLDGRF